MTGTTGDGDHSRWQGPVGDTLAWVDPSAPPPGSDAATCDQLSALCSLRTAAEARELVLIAHLCDTAPAPTGPPVPGQARLVPGGADGTPRIPEFLHLEVGPLLGLTPYSARRLVSDTLDLRHRHPRTWQAVLAGRVRVGLARRAAALCAAAGLRRDQARAVDDAVAERLPALSFGRGVALVEAEIIRADPQAQRRREEAARRQRFVRLGRQDTSGTRMLFARLPAADAIHVRAMVERLSGILADLGDTRSQGERDARALGVMATPARAVALLAGAAAAAAPGPAGEGDPDAGMRAPWSAPEALREVADLLPTTDLDRLAPPTPLYVHANAAHLGPDDLARVEGGGAILLDRLRELLADSKVRLTQVIDCRDTTAVDAYEVPPAMREQLNLTEPVEVFPWSVRRSRGLDADHCRPYVRGRPGQTRITNLGPLTRPVHRAKTHAGFRLTTLGGVRLWRTPIGRRYTVSRDGTRRWSQYTSDLEALVGHRLSRRPSADP